MATESVIDEESLFSLELVVDKISLPKIVCRFPAVAFRLLDFPTLLIYHVEPDLAEVIRDKISKDPHYKVPQQLHELQDKHGDFPVRKGKSCLFKVPLKILHNHLSNTPLYVMVIDTYPEVPKLIGSCSVPLDDSMQLICSDVDNMGLSVPSVHGEKENFTIFNMMGTEIGKVELGFRLLSLGVGLIPHIPDNAVVKFKQKTINLDEPKDATKAKETADVVLHDIQTIDKPVQVDIFTSGPTMEQIMQTEDEQLQTVATQTQKEKRKYRHKDRSAEMADELFVTNTLCPPPLFYNSKAEPKKHIKPGLTFTDGTFQFTSTSDSHGLFVNGATAIGLKSDGYSETFFEDEEDNYSEYSDSTIRHEDKFSDSETEEFVDFKASKITSKRKPMRKTLLRSSPEESRSQLVARAASFQAPNIMGNMAQFPLINALLGEIVNLQGLGGQMIPSGSPGQSPKKLQKVGSAWEETSSPRSVRKQESREEFLHRIATPRGEHEHEEGDPGFYKGKRSCATPQKSVPKNKSWLRKEPEKKQPEHGVKKPKLFYGMTNTQRLRLAKGNPELLKTLEKKEELRIAERKKNQKQTKPEPVTKPSVKQRMSTSKGIREASSDTKFSITLDSAGRETMESPKQHKRPVPTPRLSLTGDKKDQKAREYFTAGKQRLIRQMAQLSHTPSEEKEPSEYSYHTAEPQQSDRSQKSIEVYLPSADVPDDNEDATCAEESEFEEAAKSALGETKVLAGPGFPRESVDSRLSMISSYSAQYSDDFEDEKYGNSCDEPALRRVVEKYSDESVQEPSLRKIVDHYSDEAEEPSLRKVVDKYSDDDTLSGKEPSLRRVVDQYSEDSASNKSDIKSNGSFHSARSNKSRQSSPEEIPKDDMKIKNLPMPNPTSSLRSPTPHHKLGSSVVTRAGMAASTPSADESESDPESSTARIPKSQMPSQSFETGTSLDSTGEAVWKRRRQPRPSPRHTLERIRTESVSSYNPSDSENLSPVSPGEPEDLYSESFDDYLEQPSGRKYVKDIKIPASAKGLGYTWT